MTSVSPSSFPGSSGFYAPAPDATQSRRRRRAELTVLGVVSYAVDAALMLAFAVVGVLPAVVGLAYWVVGWACIGLFYLLLRSRRGQTQSDPLMVTPQLLCHSAIVLAFMAWAPQIGVLLLMVLFIVLGFGGLQMNVKRGVRVPVGVALALAVGLMAAIVWAGDRLSVPLATGPQRTVSGLWCALLLVRFTLLGVYGARLRSQLSLRNADLADAFKKLNRLAHRDELTGALNRRSVMRILEGEHRRLQRSGTLFAVALIDLDHFKAVNDRHGHLVGDEVLRRFTLRSAAEMRTTDRLGRYGGEEFLLVITEIDAVEAATVAVERVRDGVARHDWPDVAAGLRVTASIGVALVRPGETVEQLLQRADEALYAAKRAGRNCTRVA